ncbi:uncharacterized protein FA14DRAFT_153101 [Meira miltonrushii]|uniref:Uncharacterized protein n=1 Tax=Meira miltonrushii TaxID=1280837 RepID=A0A316VJE6_9BASI|nr:uncharacterized protein FA14DRAFT_153101 [Meira miltonrushii]PWN37742.1 hypothetical protein FA14DRAFT_153101 [Meira miltonrushii]
MLSKKYATFVLFAMLGYAKAFPVLPMHFFLPHHDELDEFGAPVHHLHDDLYADDVDHDDHNMHDHDFNPAYDYYMDHDNYDHDYSAPVHDPSVHTDHAYYSHSYGIEPSVNAIELDVNAHQDRHHLAEMARESMFANSKASHGFDATMDFLDGVHHDHLHHDHRKDGHHASVHGVKEHLYNDHHHPHHAYKGQNGAYDQLYDEHHYPLEHHQDHVADPHSFDWFHQNVHGSNDVHEAQHRFVKRDLASESEIASASHPLAKDDLIHKDLQKNDTSSSTKVALASTLIGASPNPLATKIHHASSQRPNKTL